MGRGEALMIIGGKLWEWKYNFFKKIVGCILPIAYSFLPVFSYFGEIRDLGWSCKVWFEENRLSQLDFE